jgi:MFS superfamily sulfate permease-like transporter
MTSKPLSPTRHLGQDAPAGLVVFLVALPLCLGVALASTQRPDLLFSGIIAGFVGGIVVGLLSRSALGVSGPAAGLVTIVVAAIGTLGSFEAFLLAVVMAGVIQVIAGFLKAGVIGYYFPSAVIKGMLAAIGLTLILKEIPHLLGVDNDYIGDVAFEQADGRNTVTEIIHAFKNPSLGAVIISAVSILLLLVFELKRIKAIRIFKYVPGALVVVIAGVALNEIFLAAAPDLAMTGQHLVQLPVASTPSEFISFFRTPDFSAIGNPDVWIIALTLAVVASLETLLSVEATDKLDPWKRLTPNNRELKAQGIGNILSGLIGGLPVTQVIVRSTANVNAGGVTRMATIIHGFILLLTAIFIPALINRIPLAALAAILLMVGYKLSRVSLYRQMYRLGWDQFLPFIVTVVAILVTDLLKGIGIGMAVALYFILIRNYRNNYHLKREQVDDRELIHLTLSEEVTFLNKGSIQLTLEKLPERAHVVIDGSRSVAIDYDVLEAIQEFRQHKAPSRAITVETRNIPEVALTGGH